MTSSTQLKANDKRLKGEKGVLFFKEDGLYKYTMGASPDYNEIYNLRKKLSAKFPQAFIIAFKNGQKTDVQLAIQEFKNRKK